MEVHRLLEALTELGTDGTRQMRRGCGENVGEESHGSGGARGD